LRGAKNGIFGGDSSSSWWVDALEATLFIYRLRAEDLHGGPRPIAAGVGLVRMTAAPIQRNADGTMRNAWQDLLPAEADMLTNTVAVVGNGSSIGPPAYTSLNALGVGGMSAAFWATDFMEYKTKREFDVRADNYFATIGPLPTAASCGSFCVVLPRHV